MNTFCTLICNKIFTTCARVVRRRCKCVSIKVICILIWLFKYTYTLWSRRYPDRVVGTSISTAYVLWHLACCSSKGVFILYYYRYSRSFYICKMHITFNKYAAVRTSVFTIYRCILILSHPLSVAKKIKTQFYHIDKFEIPLTSMPLIYKLIEIYLQVVSNS